MKSFATVTTPIVLPWPLRSGLEAATRALFELGDQSPADFLRPVGEAALVPADSISWRVFKNPLSLFIGGVAAVILELAEPRVRTGVWEHTTFRTDPIRRLRRTGLAAMVTIYGARCAFVGRHSELWVIELPFLPPTVLATAFISARRSPGSTARTYRSRPSMGTAHTIALAPGQ